MSEFKVGDIVKGISDKYLFTNRDMLKGEVIAINYNSIDIKIIEHKN